MLKSDLDNPEFAKLIFDLVQDEGSAVQIVHANADFDGPNSTIYVKECFGSYVQYFGESTIDCLRQAIETKERQSLTGKESSDD